MVPLHSARRADHRGHLVHVVVPIGALLPVIVVVHGLLAAGHRVVVRALVVVVVVALMVVVSDVPHVPCVSRVALVAVLGACVVVPRLAPLELRLVVMRRRRMVVLRVMVRRLRVVVLRRERRRAKILIRFRVTTPRRAAP